MSSVIYAFVVHADDTNMLKTKQKQTIIKKFKKSDNDTGSPEVQIALLHEDITALTDHLKVHKKDDHSRRGLIGKVAQRRKLLNYLMKKDEKRYKKLIKSLGLKK